MSNRRGPPTHQNQYAWKPNAGRKINETEPGGRFRPLSEITGVCPRCKEQIDWKRRYGKYKPLKEPAKCQRCSKRTVRQAYHNLCSACAKEQNVCAKEQNVCAKCCCRVDQIVGRASEEAEAEQKILGEAIKNARERDRRALLRAMNRGKTKNSEKNARNEGNKVGDLFPTASLEQYAAKSRGPSLNVGGRNDCDSDSEYEDNNGKEIDKVDDGDGNEDESEGEGGSEDEDNGKGDCN